MTIIDSQVHAYEANTAKRPWHNVPNWPDHVTGDEMVAAMDKVGVDNMMPNARYLLVHWEPARRGLTVEPQRRSGSNKCTTQHEPTPKESAALAGLQRVFCGGPAPRR